MMLEAAEVDAAGAGGAEAMVVDKEKEDCVIIGVAIGNQVALGDGVDLRSDLFLDQITDSSRVPSKHTKKVCSQSTIVYQLHCLCSCNGFI